MYAYIDETGNTGHNLFDKSQPFFITAALLSRTNFDLIYTTRLRWLANRIGEHTLHAKELGLGKIEDIASDLLDIFKQVDVRFFLSRVEKKYLATTKLVDTIFDSGENLAVPWHSYNYRPLRLLLVCKVAFLLDENLVKEFWACIMERNKAESYRRFVVSCEGLRSRVGDLPDNRSRELISDALRWATQNPEAIYIHSNSKIVRYGHLPNMVAFTNLLDGIEDQSKVWGRWVRRITHDRQMQFETSLKFWHELFANANPDPLVLPGGERHTFRRVFGSEFVISSAEDSAGIQATDIVWWLFKRVIEGRKLGSNSVAIMRYVFPRAKQHDFSFEATSQYLSEFFEMLERNPITEEQMRKGQEFLQAIESRRQEQMLEYAERKLLDASCASRRTRRKRRAAHARR